MTELPPAGWLPDKLYAKLQRSLGFELLEPHRRLIEAGIARALIDRDVQLDTGVERRALYKKIEQSAAALVGALNKASTHVHFPFWMLYLGADEALRKDLLRGQVHPTAHLLHLVRQVRVVKLGATAMLKSTPKSRGARERRERDLMCGYIAEAISKAGGWSSGTYDAKAVDRFARLLFPRIPKTVAHKSADAFVEQLCKAFNAPDFGRREKFAQNG
jgi:hypothetical protein